MIEMNHECQGTWVRDLIVLSIVSVFFGLGLGYGLGYHDIVVLEREHEVVVLEREHEVVVLEREVAFLERQLVEKDNSDKPVIETAKFINISYEKLLDNLNRARREDAAATNPLAVSILIDQYKGRRIKWDCIILRKNNSDKWCIMGLSPDAERKDQIFAQFCSDEFDYFVKEGDRRIIEGVFGRVDESGILLHNCRFMP